MTAADQARRVRAGDVTAVELVEAALAAVERSQENAFATVCAERALEQAAQVRPGDPRPLCGVPIAIKDLLSATEGIPTAHGSAAFGDWVADHDSAHIRRLREAGAIIVGKTTTPELGLRPVTESARYGVTRNPRNPSLSAGGSSGGSAAAVGAGIVALADGSDLGGSIRIPASCCGVIGFKPSRGRVSIGPDYGDLAGGAAVDGVLATTVEDVRLAFAAMAGYEPGEHHFSEPRPHRLTRVKLALDAPLGVPVDEAPRAAARRAAAALSALGHEVVEGVPDWDDEVFPAAWGLFVTGVLAHFVRVLERLHGRFDPELLEPATRAWLSEPRLVDYLEARERLVAFARRVLRVWPDGEVLVTPTLTRLPAPVQSLVARAGVTDDGLRFSALVRMWNVTGQPAISLPLHETADGVPVGVQIVGPPGGDELILELAQALSTNARAAGGA